MDRSKWEKSLTCFQASARGFLVRNQVRRGREDFEDIVKEIDGGLDHLVWREMVIPFPHFTDTDSLFQQPTTSAGKFSNPRLAACASPRSPPSSSPSSAPLSEERIDHRVEAEKDDSQTKGQAFVSKHLVQSSNVTVGGGSQKDGDYTTVRSRLELDMNDGQSKAPRLLCLTKEVPCTPEALRLHRNTLTMELVWLQQAIDSRKKYLSLKDRLSVS
ncbi:IQ domain-containing protein C [Pungitius pungitius]|uniref:IQ domain-containing protein C n=1 Tax=Pungitius pungitius TaxID=134920 RepID=UPI002E14D439